VISSPTERPGLVIEARPTNLTLDGWRFDPSMSDDGAVSSKGAGLRRIPFRGREPSPSSRDLLLRFGVAGLIALAIVVVATALVSRRVAEREGIAEAERIAWTGGRGVVQPALIDGILEIDPDAVFALDRVVKGAVLSGSLVRVKLWRADGTIVYSDEGKLIGQRYAIDSDERAILESGGIEAEISNLDKPENRFEASQGKLLEAYLPVTTPNGTRLLYEAYFRYEGVADAGRSIWLTFAPITIGALVLLGLVQLPLAWSLASSLRRSQEQRELLLRHAVDASERERGRIARDLHDGVVQDLSGVSFALAAATRNPRLELEERELLETTSTQVRDSVGSLRSLLVDIYPPNLREEGLRTALDNLLAGLANRDIRTSLEFDLDERELDTDVEALLYRGAQEAVRNVLKHAGATHVSVLVAHDDGCALLVVEDDGQGFDAARADAMSEPGHVGLRALADLVAEVGGTVDVASDVEQGTEVRVEIPLGP